MTVPEAARAYHEAGYSVATLAPGKKVPWKDTKPSLIRAKPQTMADLEALFSGRNDANIGVLTGSCSGDLAVIDVDSREAWAKLDNYAIIRRLKAASAVVATRRGYHLYVRLPWPAKSATIPAIGDLKAEGGLVAAPPSVVRREHCQAQLYLWSGDGFRPAYPVNAQELADLICLIGIKSVFDVAPGTAPDLDADLTGAFYGLGAGAWEALRKPDPSGDRSAAEQKAIYRAVCIGFTLADVRELFSRHAAPGTKYADKVREGFADKWLEISYLSAVNEAARKMTPYMITVNEALRAMSAGAQPFGGRGKWTDSRVYCAILQVVREAGRPRVYAPVRTMAMLSGVDSSNCFASMQRLRDAGAICIAKDEAGLNVSPDSGFMSGVILPKQNNLTHSLRVLSGSSIQAEAASGNPGPAARIVLHDAFSFKALGPSGPVLRSVINALHGEAFTLADLSACGLPHMTLVRKVSLLLRAGVLEVAEGKKDGKPGRKALVYRCPHRIGMAELDRIASLAGTAGAGERKRKRYEKEREAMKRWKERERGRN